MDFLDPKKKRARQVRLNIGHALMVILVFVATYIMVFRAYGYDIDTKTGEVIQNGLVYIDSAPDGATIKINGKVEKSNTNTRLSLVEGAYNLEISKDGYRPWQRSFNLEGGEVLRFTYPMLLPNELNSAELQALDSVTFATESPNRRWILLSTKNNLQSITLVDLEQRTEEKPTSSTLTFNQSLLTPAAGDHQLKLIEWSTDNRHLLVQHNWSGGQEFVMLDREKPAESYNVNRVINQNPSQVSLFDKSFDKLFIYDAATKKLARVDIKTRSITDFANDVISYKSHGDDTVMLSQIDPVDKTKANIIIRHKDKSYSIRQIPLADNIPLDIARFDGKWYIVFGVSSEERSFVYKNPLDLTSNPDAVRAIVLRNRGAPQQVAFSQNTRFIMSRAGQNFSVYDAEQEKRASYTINQPFDAGLPPTWMDGHRLMAVSGGKVIVFDYDGINQHTLVSADPNLPPMFDRDYTELYTIASSSTAVGKSGLFLTQLRLEGDK